MSQDQQATRGVSPTGSLAADMPRVPGAETAKSIIENAVHPSDGQAMTNLQDQAGAPLQAQPQSAAAQGQPAGMTAADVNPNLFVDQVIDIPLMGETLTLTKRAVVTEEVRLSKRAIAEGSSVTDTVRRERVSVEGADVVKGADSEADDATGALSAEEQIRPTPAGEHRHDGGFLEEVDQKIDRAVDKLFGHDR